MHNYPFAKRGGMVYTPTIASETGTLGCGRAAQRYEMYSFFASLEAPSCSLGQLPLTLPFLGLVGLRGVVGVLLRPRRRGRSRAGRRRRPGPVAAPRQRLTGASLRLLTAGLRILLKHVCLCYLFCFHGQSSHLFGRGLERTPGGDDLCLDLA